MTNAGMSGYTCRTTKWRTQKAIGQMYAKIVEAIHSWHKAGWAHVRSSLSLSPPHCISPCRSPCALHALNFNMCRVTCILATSVSVIGVLWAKSSSLTYRHPPKVLPPSERTGLLCKVRLCCCGLCRFVLPFRCLQLMQICVCLRCNVCNRNAETFTFPRWLSTHVAPLSKTIRGGVDIDPVPVRPVSAADAEIFLRSLLQAEEAAIRSLKELIPTLSEEIAR